MSSVLKRGLLGLFGLASILVISQTTVSADNRTGYVYAPEVSLANGGWNWLENGRPFTGFRYYMGTYYWFENGVRQNESWRSAWGLTYYTDQDGRAVQGNQLVDGKVYDFGTNGTYYSRGVVKDAYVDVAGIGWRWVTNGQMFTGFRYYMGAYYWFENGVRQDSQWETAWGLTYYVGADGRAVQGIQTIGGKKYNFGTDGTFFVRNLPAAPTAKRPTYFSQWDSRWANTYFSGGSFGETGCVPTSIAMVLKGSYGVNVTPRTVGNQIGKPSESYGASGQDLMRMVSAYGHSATSLGNISQVKTTLQQGKPVIFFVNVGIGHAVVAYGLHNGLTEVFDPYNRQFFNGSYSVETLMNRLSADSQDWDAGTPIFAIN